MIVSRITKLNLSHLEAPVMTQTLCCWTSLKPRDWVSWQEREGRREMRDLTSPVIDRDCWADLVMNISHLLCWGAITDNYDNSQPTI